MIDLRVELLISCGSGPFLSINSSSFPLSQSFIGRFLAYLINFTIWIVRRLSKKSQKFYCEGTILSYDRLARRIVDLLQQQPVSLNYT